MAQSKARKARTEALILNSSTYEVVYEILKEIVLNLYEWHNLPKTMNEQYFEEVLFENGKGLLFVDDIIGCLGLPYTDNGLRNIYNLPTLRNVYSNANNYRAYRNQNNSVIVFNNYLRQSSRYKIDLFAKKLYEISRAIDTNVRLQKTSKIIGASEEQQLSIQNAVASYDGNFPFIFTDKSFNLDSIKDFNVDTPYVADKLEMLFHETFNDFLTYFGVPNNPVNKKERLITDEANGNDSVVELFQNSGLSARNKACQEFNEMIKRLRNNPKYRKAIERSWVGDMYVTFRGVTETKEQVIKETQILAENNDVPREKILSALFKLLKGGEE